MSPQKSDVAAVEAYLEQVPEPKRSTLEKLRMDLRRLLPDAEEALSYGIPAFRINGKSVAGYASGKKFCSYYPHSGRVISELSGHLREYETTSGSIHFPIDESLPFSLVALLVRTRLDDLADVRNGAVCHYYDDGSVKAEGAMRNGELHGTWSWYRKDGSLMRTGSFTRGEQSGEWNTYDRTGRLVRTTNYDKR